MNKKMRAFLGMKDVISTSTVTMPDAPRMIAEMRDVYIDPGLDGAEVEMTTDAEGKAAVRVTPEMMAESREANSPVTKSLNPDNLEKKPTKKRRSKKQATDLD